MRCPGSGDQRERDLPGRSPARLPGRSACCTAPRSDRGTTPPSRDGRGRRAGARAPRRAGGRSAWLPRSRCVCGLRCRAAQRSSASATARASPRSERGRPSDLAASHARSAQVSHRVVVHRGKAVHRELDHQRRGLRRVAVRQLRERRLQARVRRLVPAEQMLDARAGSREAHTRRVASAGSSSMPSSRAVRASVNCPVAAWASARAVRSSTRSLMAARHRRAVAALRRTSAPHSPACAALRPLLPRAGRRPPRRRRGARSARRGAPAPRAEAPRAASASALRRWAPRRQPPARRRRPLVRTSGCRKRKRRGTSVGRTRSLRSSSSSALTAAASLTAAAAATSSGSNGSPATAAPSSARRAVVREAARAPRPERRRPRAERSSSASDRRQGIEGAARWPRERAGKLLEVERIATALLVERRRRPTLDGGVRAAAELPAGSGRQARWRVSPPLRWARSRAAARRSGA